MPKIQKLRKHKVEAKPYAAKSTGNEEAVAVALAKKGKTDGNGQPMLSRGQKKRQQRKDRITNVKAMIENSNNPNKPKGQATFLFSDLEMSLPQNAEVVRPSALAPKSNKMKGKVAVREVERMKLIQEHPSFKQDPLAAIKFHLEHMVSVNTAQPSK